MVLKPTKSFQVEVVRRLVQQKQIRLLDQQPREMRPHDPPAAQLPQRTMEIPLAEGQPRQNSLRHCLRPAIRLVARSQLHDCIITHRSGLLWQETHTRPALQRHLPLVRFVMPQQQREESRFASAIRTNKPDAIARVHLQRRVLEKNPPAKRFGHL